MSWRKLKCRWLGMLLSSLTSRPIPKAPSLISLSSHFSLCFFFISFPPIPLVYLSLQFSFILYLVLHSVHPHFLSAPLFPPCSCPSLRSKLHVAMNSLWAVNPQEQQQSSAIGKQISFLRFYYTCLWLWHSGARFLLRTFLIAECNMYCYVKHTHTLWYKWNRCVQILKLFTPI